MLRLTALHQSVPAEVVLSQHESLRYAQQVLKRAIDDGNLKMTNGRPVRSGRHRITNRAVTITPQGFRFLLETAAGGAGNAGDRDGWMYHLDPEQVRSRTSLLGRQLGEMEMRRLLRFSETNAFCGIAGISTALTPNAWVLKGNETECDDNGGNSGDGAGSILEMICRAEQEEGEDSRGKLLKLSPSSALSLPDNFKRFLTMRDIRAELLLGGGTGHDYDRCTAAGIADGKRRVIMLYTHHDVGFRWTEWNRNFDIKILKLYRSRYSILSPPLNPDPALCGAVLIRNAQELKRIYRDTDGVRRWVRKEGEQVPRNVLGDGLDRLYAVPKTNAGAKHLNELLTCTDTERISAFILPLVASGRLERYEDYPDVFPVRLGGVPYAAGVYMDINRMKRMELLKTRGMVKEFGILCYEWQMPYYEALFPDSTVRDIEKV